MFCPYTMGFFCRTILLGLLLLSSATPSWAAPRKPTEHVVQPGQTLAKIAKRYNLSIEELCEENDLKRSTPLKPGQKLSLPGDDDEEPTSRTRPRNGDDKTPASTSGRGSGTAQKSNLLHHASFSRYLSRPVKRGYVHLLGFHGEFKGQLVGKSGRLQEKSVVAISRVMAWPRTDFIMDRRLLLLLAKVSDAFGGRTIRLVSGYRTTSYASESKHPLGRACDFSILGVPNEALRDYARTFSDVGVGYYPNSTFVHMDARDYDAYWVDYAGPGEAPRYRNAVAKKDDDENKHRESGSRDRTSRNAPGDKEEETNNVVTEALADSAKETPEARSRSTAVTEGKATDDATGHKEPSAGKVSSTPGDGPATEAL
jgi:uncharacterized protein YcbK (DUF882 family)